MDLDSLIKKIKDKNEIYKEKYKRFKINTSSNEEFHQKIVLVQIIIAILISLIAIIIIGLLCSGNNYGTKRTIELSNFDEEHGEVSTKIIPSLYSFKGDNELEVIDEAINHNNMIYGDDAYTIEVDYKLIPEDVKVSYINCLTDSYGIYDYKRIGTINNGEILLLDESEKENKYDNYFVIIGEKRIVYGTFSGDYKDIFNLDNSEEIENNIEEINTEANTVIEAQ